MLNINNLEEVIQPAIRPILQYINIKNAITIADMKFLIEKGLVDEAEYRAYIEASKDNFIEKVIKLGGKDETVDLVNMAKEEFETHLTNF